MRQLKNSHVVALAIMGPLLLGGIPIAVASNTSPTAQPSVGNAPPDVAIPAVGSELRLKADAAIAANPLVGRLKKKDQSATLSLINEGPWTDGFNNLLGVVREYRFDRPVDTEQEYWPFVLYVDDDKFTKFKNDGYKMKVKGLRQFRVLTTNEGELVSIRVIERESVSDIDAKPLDIKNVRPH